MNQPAGFRYNMTTLALATVAVVMTFQNCGRFSANGVRFSTSEAERKEALSPNIFADTVLDTPTDSAAGQIFQDGSALNTEIRLRLMCSDVGSNMTVPFWGGALSTASKLKFSLMSTATGSLTTGCEFTIDNTDDVKSQMMVSKRIPMVWIADRCRQMPFGRYYLVIQDPAVEATRAATIYSKNSRREVSHTDAILRSEPGEDLVITRSADGWAVNDRVQTVLADRNPFSTTDTRPFNYLTSNQQCDAESSPLMIKLVASQAVSMGLHLTDPANGIMFDLLGQTALPAYSPVRISWVTNDNFAFLVLPNANGLVSGIDNLFGDRTLGPDGKLAVNGYDALVKWDGRALPGSPALGGLRDGVIDQADPVFYALRLWIDKNRDGVSQPNELLPLSAHDITAIDLLYDARYYERDIYGNEIRFKSVVRTSKAFLTMFDLWFNYKGGNSLIQ